MSSPSQDKVIVSAKDSLFATCHNIIIAGGHKTDEGPNGHLYDDIVEYNPEEDTMTTVGHMIQTRAFQAISVVEVTNYANWCYSL